MVHYNEWDRSVMPTNSLTLLAAEPSFVHCNWNRESVIDETSRWKSFGWILVNLALASRLICNNIQCLFSPLVLFLSFFPCFPFFPPSFIFSLCQAPWPFSLVVSLLFLTFSASVYPIVVSLIMSMCFYIYNFALLSVPASLSLASLCSVLARFFDPFL